MEYIHLTLDNIDKLEGDARKVLEHVAAIRELVRNMPYGFSSGVHMEIRSIENAQE